MDDTKNKFPDQKELEKELSEYLSKKYGDRIKIISPFIMPKPVMDDGKGRGRAKGVSKINFNLRPEELEAYLNEYVIKQDRAKSVLATKVCTHFNRIRYSLEDGKRPEPGVGSIKNNIILIGPTGVGKTYLVKLIAKKIGVPFVKGDATKFSETGYVGGDVEDLIRDLVYEANDDLELAQYGIIYIDEIDKIASAGNLIGPDVSRSGVQRALLKPMEETEVDLKVPHDPISQIQAIEQYRKTGRREKRTLNTRNILFIVSGAFYGLDKIIRERLSKQEIGFHGRPRAKEADREFLSKVAAEDLIKYGFESEFIGRLPVVVVLDELTADDLYQILKNPNNPIIISKKRDFRAYGIDIKFEDQALWQLAELAAQEKTGARGLVSATEKVLIQFEKRLPSTQITELLITPDVVANPEQELERLLANPDNPGLKERFQAAAARERELLKESVWRREKEFLRHYHMPLTDYRVELMVDQYLRWDCDLHTAFDEICRLYAQVRRFEDDFYTDHQIHLSFDQAAVDEILRRALTGGISAAEVCKQFSKDLEYALKLVRDKSSQNTFLLPREAIIDLDSFLNQLFQESLQQTFWPGRR
ncbi:MAG: AAA family ATPase [Deltaproteobacteria bacterium]|nr:AAA family ATPase [Deltaproteobacteria bacterium]MBW2134305.1 AAA family ATPase [Deltaproteobacteria bacterium]